MSVAFYLVRRTAWDGGFSTPFSESHSWQGSYEETVGPRNVPVASFATEREAKADAHRRNAEARAGRSPFWFSEVWRELSDLSLHEAATRLTRRGFNLPPPKHADDSDGDLYRTCRAWREWWDRESADWTAEQTADAWAVFGKLRFYDVVEIEMED